MKKMGFVYCRWLGRLVYGSFLPMEAHYLNGAENYLPDIWLVAPKRVAFIHTVLATLFLFLPGIILMKPRLIFQLSPEELETFQKKMITSRFFLIRTMIYGIRGHALVAILRDPKARLKVLAKESDNNHEASLAG